MKVTLLAVVALTTVATALVGAADPECVYRKLRGLQTHWPKPSSCSSYYRCAKGLVRTVKCPAGKEYNPKTGKCGTAGRGLCKLSLVAPFADATNPCADEVNGAFVAKSGYCTEYFICDEQVAYPQICDSGSLYNTTLNACVPDVNSECWQNACIDKENGIFVENEEYCASYYICLNNVPTLQTCPTGSYFNTNLNACTVDEDDLQCWENFCIGKKDATLVADKNNCSIYYVCSDEKATIQSCDEGYYFDSIEEKCLAGQCDDSSTTTTKSGDDSTSTITSSSPTEPCEVETTTPAPTNCDCSNGIKDGQIVANEANCRAYVICVNGELIPGDCLKGNYFNPQLNICQVDEDNVCPESCTPDCSEGNVTVKVENCAQYNVCKNGVWEIANCSVGYFFNSTLGICTIDDDGVCPNSNECNSSDQAASGSTCWQYYACINGKWQQESCLSDQFFDASVGICRVDDDGACPENKAIKSGSRSKRSVSQEQKQEQEQEQEQQGCEEGTIQAHPTDCDKYLICQNQQLIPGTCGVGNVFKNCSGICAPDNAGTCWICGHAPNGYQLANPSDCTGYIVCNNGLANEKSCPSGEWFDGNACAIDVTGVCINPCSDCNTGTKPHPICSKYYQCSSSGPPKVVDCNGQGYNSTTGECSSNTECNALLCSNADNDGATYPVNDDDTKFYLCLNGDVSIRSCPVNRIYIAEVGACILQPSDECDQCVCKDAPDDLPYPSLGNDNSTFCLCSNNSGYLESCPNGKEFNEENGACLFSGPCDPSACVAGEEYKVSPNYEDSDSFCLCRAGEQVPVPCPIGYTFNAEALLCVVIPQPDPRCCRNYCVGKVDDLTFSPISPYTGFCVCHNEIPFYEDCLNGDVYDPELGACQPVVEECDENNNCDHSVCTAIDNLGYTFPASNGSTYGFCYCKGDCAIWSACPDGKQYIEELGVCLAPDVELCDSTECASLPEYDTFLPIEPEQNTGFCVCRNGSADYVDCPKYMAFNDEIGVCLLVPAPASVCNIDKCLTMNEFDTFAASNTTSGFCLCESNIAIYVPCLENYTYIPDLGTCLSNDTTKFKQLNGCDNDQCKINGLFEKYSASNTTNGYCACNNLGQANYYSCQDEHHFNIELKSCVIMACDSDQCRKRGQFAAFAAKNTTSGFCSCDGQATYHHCNPGHIFDINQGVCVLQTAISSVVCDRSECKRRAEFQPFAAINTTAGFCSCDGIDANGEISITYHACTSGHTFIAELGVCFDTNSRSKRSVKTDEHEEDVEKLSCEIDEKRSVPSNCSQYEICIDGNWRRRTCSDYRYYNPEQQRCLEPRDDMVCKYARITHLPQCNNQTEAQTAPGRGNNCLQYYRCTSDKWRLRNCPKQQYFARKVGTCLSIPKDLIIDNDLCTSILMRENNITITETCQNLAVRPSSVGCTTYLMCLDNAWWQQQCPLNMYFSNQHNYCLPNDGKQCNGTEYRNQSTCLTGQKRSSLDSCRAYEECNTAGQWMRLTCNRGEQFESMFGCVPSDNYSCQANGFRRVCQTGEIRSLPLMDETETNCQQYFQYCDNENWLIGNCLRGQSFVRDQRVCLPREECQSQAIKLKYLSTSCQNQSNGQIVADVEDCTRFYLCLQQEAAILQNCASGSFFDPILGYCRPNDGSCKLPICDGLDDGSLIGHPIDCRAYYSCSHNNGTQLIYCNEGEYYHNILSQCLVDHGQCRSQNQNNDTDTDDIITISRCTGKHGIQLQHELYCNLYYACVKGLAIPVECPIHQQFNPVLGHCEKEEESWQKCENGQLDGNITYSCGSLTDGAYLANRTDCTRYFICAGGIALAQRCGSGQYFDAEQLLCITDDGSCPYVDNGNDDDNNDDDDDNNGNNQHIPPDPLVCEGKHGLIMPDPANCNNFYICISSKLRHECCYTGYFFNATLLQCQAYNVDEDDSIPNENANQTESMKLYQLQVQHECNDLPTNFYNICQIIGNGSSVAEQGDCRRYTSCETDVPTSQRCRNGESFDSLLGICRQNDGTCLMENGERVGICNGKHGQFAQNSENCAGYFVCVHGQKIETDCEHGEYFNKLTNTCQEDVQQQCNANTEEAIKNVKL